MDAQLKQKWVKALRSGDFEQVREELTDGIGFCCIGVAYEVAGYKCDEIEDMPPTETAADKLGLSINECDALVDLNDTRRLSFPEIADYIEREIPND